MTNSVSLFGNHSKGTFHAMAGPCEILVDSSNLDLTQQLVNIAQQEALRIQKKFSRYDDNSICSKINFSSKRNESIGIDLETFKLLEYADKCFEISNGMFDITSGILRQAWTFDGSDKIPSQQEIDPLLDNIGWWKVNFDSNQITLPSGMELDFGGIAKEYAVDRTAKILTRYIHSTIHKDLSILINFGGDLFSTGIKFDQCCWQVGIEDTTNNNQCSTLLSLTKGALATSGNANRYLLKNGRRYGHILDPNTGWPIENTPNSVTVAAPQCITAGMLATLALLQGENAKEFLKQQSVDFWIN